MKRNSLVKAIGCLTLASVTGCSTAAHSLGGDESQQRIEGNGRGNSADSGSGNSAGNDNGAGGGSSAENGNGGATAAPNPSPEAGPSGLPCAPCADVVAGYGAQVFTFAGCCLPSGACGVDVGTAATFVHGSVSSSPDPMTEVALTIAPGCQPRDQVGVPDTSCPSMGATQSNEFEGCCRSDGTCGANLGLIHAGCVQAQRQLHQTGAYKDGGALPGLPSPLPPQTCNYPN